MYDTFILAAMALLVCVPGAAYALRVLVFDYKAPGPFEAKSTFVRDNAGLVTRPVNAFDRFRRFFGLYRVTTDQETGVSYWSVNPLRVDMWLCPKCLSFWLSIPWSVGIVAYLVLTSGDLRTALLWPLLHGQIVWWSQILVFVQLRLEGE